LTLELSERDSKVSLRREQCGAHPAMEGGIGGESGLMEPEREATARVGEPVSRSKEKP